MCSWERSIVNVTTRLVVSISSYLYFGAVSCTLLYSYLWGLNCTHIYTHKLWKLGLLLMYNVELVLMTKKCMCTHNHKHYTSTVIYSFHCTRTTGVVLILTTRDTTHDIVLYYSCGLHTHNQWQHPSTHT